MRLETTKLPLRSMARCVTGRSQRSCGVNFGGKCPANFHENPELGVRNCEACPCGQRPNHPCQADFPPDFPLKSSILGFPRLWKLAHQPMQGQSRASCWLLKLQALEGKVRHDQLTIRLRRSRIPKTEKSRFSLDYTYQQYRTRRWRKLQNRKPIGEAGCCESNMAE